jgi:hypothetical protein
VRALVKPEEFKGFTDAIEKGNYVKVRELFAQVHNREVDRLKRFNNATDQDPRTAREERAARTRWRSTAGPCWTAKAKSIQS